MTTDSTMKALVTANLDDDSLHRLRTDLEYDVDYRPIVERSERYSTDELVSLLEGVNLFIVGYEGVSAEVMDAVSDLEIIACTRGGPDANVDISAASERGIPVLFAPGRNATSVADFTIGLMLAAARNIAHSHHLLHTGTYTGHPQSDSAEGGEREDVTWGIAAGSPYAELKGPELGEKTLGIIGLGAIGQEVAQRATGFAMDLVGFDPYIDADEMAEHGVEKRDDLDPLLEESHFVTLHVPVMDETRGLLGAEEFEMMREDAFFINTARGALIDQDALVEQLRSGKIRGAALDVYAQEPLPADHELLTMSNVVTTPHLAGAAEEVVEHHSEMILDDVTALLNDQQPEHVANEEVLRTKASG